MRKRKADASADPSPAPAEQAEPSGSKRKRGAPRGNSNAMTHGAFATSGLRGLRDAPRRKAQAQVREALRAAGASGDAFAGIVGDTMRTLLEIKLRGEKALDRRGWSDQRGEMKAATRTLVDVCDRLLGEARRLFERFEGRAVGADSLTALILASGVESEAPSPSRSLAETGDARGYSGIGRDCPVRDDPREGRAPDRLPVLDAPGAAEAVGLEEPDAPIHDPEFDLPPEPLPRKRERAPKSKPTAATAAPGANASPVPRGSWTNTANGERSEEELWNETED